MSNSTRYFATKNADGSIASVRSSKSNVYTHAIVIAGTADAVGFSQSFENATNGLGRREFRRLNVEVADAVEIDGKTFRATKKAEKAAAIARADANEAAAIEAGYTLTTAGEVEAGVEFVRVSSVRSYGIDSKYVRTESHLGRDGDDVRTSEYSSVGADLEILVPPTAEPETVADAPAPAAECYSCGRTDVDPSAEGVEGVELSSATNRIRFEDEKEIPEDDSQGFWTLCPRCAPAYRESGVRVVPEPFGTHPDNVAADLPSPAELVAEATNDLRRIERELRPAVDGLSSIADLVAILGSDRVSFLSDATTKGGEISLATADELRSIAAALESAATTARNAADAWEDIAADYEPTTEGQAS